MNDVVVGLDQLRQSHKLSLSSPLPGIEISLKMTDTKKQLTKIAKDDLISNLPARSNKLIITAQNETSKQVQSCVL